MMLSRAFSPALNGPPAWRVFLNCCWLKAQARLLVSLPLLGLLFQRLPAIQASAASEFSAPGRAAQLLPWITGLAALVGSHQAVSGASGDLVPVTTATLRIEAEKGSTVDWLFRVDRGGSGMNVRSYQMSPTVPGLTISRFGTGTNQGKITGIPTQAGTWTVNVRLWEEANVKGLTKVSGTPLTIIITEPADPLKDYFGDSLVRSGDWANTPWFGWFYAKNYPYVQHLQHGWLYLQAPGGAGTSLQFFDSQLGWAWTSQPAWPWIYFFGSGAVSPGWYRYGFGSVGSGGRWFYSMPASGWVLLPAPPP